MSILFSALLLSSLLFYTFFFPSESFKNHNAGKPSRSDRPLSQADIVDSLTNMRHPRDAQAFLNSAVFNESLPAGEYLSIRAKVPVVGKLGFNTDLGDLKYSWAVVYEPSGEIAAGALVDTSIPDEDFDALDAYLETGQFMTIYRDKVVYFRVGEDGHEIGPGNEHWDTFNFIVEGSAYAYAAGRKVIISNGPRWLVVTADDGVQFTCTYGYHRDGSPTEGGQAFDTNPRLFGALVATAYQDVVSKMDIFE